MKKPNISSFIHGICASKSARNRLKRLSLYYSRRHCPICGQYQHADFKLYKPHMPQCPHCHSLSRHRFVWLYFTTQINLFSRTDDQLMLYFAPEYGIYSRIDRFSKIKCISVNIHPMKLVKVSALMDITQIGAPSNTYDLIFCSHVLEHVTDDHAAMKELYRV